MGTNRLGRLPRTITWRAFLELLDRTPGDMAVIADRVAAAAGARLAQLADDDGLAYSFWLLTRIAAAARAPGFAEELQRLGIELPPDASSLSLIAAVSERVQSALAARQQSGHFAEIGALALRRALSETIGLHGPGLFGSSLDDVQAAMRQYATAARFAELAHRYFGDFLARALASFVDRELANHIGQEGGIASIAESREVLRALQTHAYESCQIMHQFAGEWFTRHVRDAEGAITAAEAQGFVAFTLAKLRGELKRQAAEA